MAPRFHPYIEKGNPKCKPLLYNVKEAAALLGVSEPMVRSLIKSGTLEAVRLNSLTKITADSIQSYIASLPRNTSSTRGVGLSR